MTELSKIRVTGPLAPYVAGFRSHFVEIGYTERSTRDATYVLAQLSRWLLAEGLAPVELTTGQLERFLAGRRAGRRRWSSIRSLRPMLDYLRSVGAVPPVDPPEMRPGEQLLVTYRGYLCIERQLAPSTIRVNVDAARQFLSRCAIVDASGLAALEPADVTAFVVDEAHRRSVGSMKVLVSALRSFLRFAFVTGLVARDLAPMVPTVAGWRLAGLPRAADAATLAALLEHCDRGHLAGVRDYAVLTLLARLGLRAGEVAALQFDDVDWSAGELVVHGKAGRVDRLPLPDDVGETLVAYLTSARPSSSCRAVFLRACAPVGPMSAKAVVMVPRNASRRAGVPVVGAHRLRHSAATEMLRGGATLAEVAQVLRHASTDTTAIYAKVDRGALVHVVRPWPGCDR
ncbi:MAG TPA: tyrosine-type recombinase/integrase [Acidimicrobiales bacterium]|nr:tyrosine-type recombinase/integrase [Acidimicrobiales bacterium]